jgi:hypothetical protein
MNKTIFLFLFFITSIFSEVPLATRKEYAQKLFDAFALQNEGFSTQAFFSFSNAFQQGIQAGESAAKLQIVADLFYWYRRYGTHLQIFSTKPSGNNRITDEYLGGNCKKHRSSKHALPLFGQDRYSEWGNDPQQAKKVRELMLGIGQVISGIFVVSVTAYSAPIVNPLFGAGLISAGTIMIWNSLNDLWTDHEVELFELQQLTNRAKAVE